MTDATTHQFVKVEFTRFKAFQRFSIELRHFNVLVGPNNAGKSTILTAFRILAAALRKANSKRSESVPSPEGKTLGYVVDLRAISVAEENIFFNYDDAQPASVVFRLSNKNQLTLYFPEYGTCYLIADANGGQPQMPSSFRHQFNCPIGFVPILGPVEHRERLFDKDAARLALFNYAASRNFRNIWYHYPEKFDDFRNALRQTWPGMDIERPSINMTHDKPTLDMFCPEQRIPREIFWSGFGFQVWCQMLTHLIQSSEASLFLIDEPDIYLHSDLQRQLLGLLRNLGPDILIATHSTEIITEAESDDIVLVNKQRHSTRRIQNPSQLGEVFKALGSNLNPILTQLAKTRRAVFVEGKDFQIIGRFARKLGFSGVGNRSDFAVIPVEGFNPERMRNLKSGMEMTLGGEILAAAILDRDHRCDSERKALTTSCEEFCSYVHILNRKEIENFLLVPASIDRAAARKVADQALRTNKALKYEEGMATFLGSYAEQKKDHILARHMSERTRFERQGSRGLSDASINEAALKEFNENWRDFTLRISIVPGKDALSAINQQLQKTYGVSITSTAIIEAMKRDEIPVEMADMVRNLLEFSQSKVP